jgi:hypothetical protein
MTNSSGSTPPPRARLIRDLLGQAVVERAVLVDPVGFEPVVGRIDHRVTVGVAHVVGVQRLRRRQGVVDSADVVRRLVEVRLLVCSVHAARLPDSARG